ncbi:Scr1 family TA system antitoxin-like transcriptional regulator [Nocardia sp. NPDC060256]|uniref:Scr1 family TA system antitoxin-like transcriptional regulator n=1 Tax=Nocardia sp. NPDC060256 TaxID=3347086 RepID=UPI00365F9658
MPQAIKARMARQRLMTAASPLHLEVVVEDDTLGRLVGGPEVMLAQLRHLLDLMKQPNVKLQVMPKAAAVHVGLDGDFTLLSFGEAESSGHPVAATTEGARAPHQTPTIENLLARCDSEFGLS